MYKILVFVILLAFGLEMSCQNGHKNQSWHTPKPKQGKAKRK